MLGDSTQMTARVSKPACAGPTSINCASPIENPSAKYLPAFEFQLSHPMLVSREILTPHHPPARDSLENPTGEAQIDFGFPLVQNPT